MANYPAINSSLAQTKYNVTAKANRSVDYILVHYTGTTASAKNNCIYFGGGNRSASADYFIDKDGTIYQFNANPKNFYSWHCGDGGGKYGITNANSIGIEVVSAGEEFTQAQKNSLQKLIAALKDDFKVSSANIKRHYDASRKLCPLAYCGTAAKDAKWEELKAYITQEAAEVITDEDAKKIGHEAARAIADWLVPMDGKPGYNDQPAWMHWSWSHSDGAYNRTVIDKMHTEIHNLYDLLNKQNETINKLHTELHNTYDLINSLKK